MRYRVLFFAGAAVALAAARSDAADKPNLLFLFTDDQATDTIRALGNPEVDTPNLDRLVAGGTAFTNAHNQGGWNGAICVASRAMLVSGRYLWHARAIHGRTAEERRAGRWWPEHLKRAGYRTYMTGKWHIPDPPENTFDVVAHVRPGMPATVEAAYDRPRDDREDAWSPSDERLGGFWEGGRHFSAVGADDAVGFLGEAAGRDEPFFMYVAFNAPHDPRQSPPEYVDRYPPEKVSLPENYAAEYPFKDAIGCGPTLRDERLAPFPRTERAVKVHRGEYYAAVTYLDAQIGRVLDALEKSGEAGETWVFFTADHGLAVGRHGLFGKQNLYEHSVRVPLVVKGPGVPAGRRIDAPVYLQDVMPTTLELAGVERPDHVDFHSLLPLIRGTGGSAYDAVYGAYVDKQRMVTAGGYKLIVYPEAKRLRLYHLAEDPLELHDLADDPAQAGTIARLAAKLREWQRRTGDPLDLAGLLPPTPGDPQQTTSDGRSPIEPP